MAVIAPASMAAWCWRAATYVRQQAQDDRHLRCNGLHGEITALGYAGSSSAFTRDLRGHGIAASGRTGRGGSP